jgi:hypothetical protein
MYFINRVTGRVRLRPVDVDQVVNIYRNPEDPKEVWFIRDSMWLMIKHLPSGILIGSTGR